MTPGCALLSSSEPVALPAYSKRYSSSTSLQNPGPTPWLQLLCCGHHQNRMGRATELCAETAVAAQPFPPGEMSWGTGPCPGRAGGSMSQHGLARDRDVHPFS